MNPPRDDELAPPVGAPDAPVPPGPPVPDARTEPDVTPESLEADGAAAPAESAHVDLEPVLARLTQLEQASAETAQRLARLGEGLEILPRQLRQLGARLEDVTESLAQPRVRDLLGSLLLLHDLVEQMGRGETQAAGDHRILLDQIDQILRVNGVVPIATPERFDPTVHKAVATEECDEAEQEGEITAVSRTGFRTERAVLRYAEVVVKRRRRVPPAVEVQS